MTRSDRGWTYIEAACALCIAGLALSLALPALGRWRERAALAAGAARLARELRELRQLALASGRSHGWLFRQGLDGWSYSVYRDQDGDGIRMADVDAGIDTLLQGPLRIGWELGGVGFGLPGPLPRIPPASGNLDPADPIELGATDILSVSPLGTSTTGTLYLQLGPRAVAAVIYGATARVRLWLHEPERSGWRRLEAPGGY
jgi:type II secretory pathway pseudopilin PulG